MDIEGSFSTSDLLSLRYPSSTSSGSLLLSSPWPVSSTPSPSSSTSSSPSSQNTLNEQSVSSSSPSSACSPPSSVPQDTSPSSSELGQVIFTTSPLSPRALGGGALTLCDPVSTHTLEVAHAPGKSILGLHEQDHGDLIHFSTSNINHVNGNGNDGGSGHLIQECHKDFITVQSSLLNPDSNALPPTSTTNTDGNLFPTLILTSGAQSSDVIPMRLYASLTNDDQTCPSNQILTTSSGDGGGTCILMTPMASESDLQLNHQLLINNDRATFTLGFDSSTNGDLQTQLSGSMLMDEYDDKQMTFAKLSTVSSYPSHGKLKDILMNGSSSHQHSLLNQSSNDNAYILRELEGAPSPSGFNPKDEIEELNPDEQSSFSDAINSIYPSSTIHHHPQDGMGGELIIEGNYGGVISAIGSPSPLMAIPPSSLSSSSGNTSVIWSNAGGQVEVSSSIPLHLDHQLMLKDEVDIGDLDGIEDDDLLEAKEEMDDYEYEEGGGKGELKCKFCGFVCCSKSSLGIHERRHTGERPFACKYCGRLFNSAQCCKHHERLHTGDKPFQCSYCGKKYAVSTRLKRHERVHTREEPYKCTECNKTFRWFDAFRDHRNTHTGVPLYLCSVCGKTFTSYLKFYYHERGHLMKKERDRDRAKQKGPSQEIWKMPREVISNTIDILKSLERNSQAGTISSLSQATMFGNQPMKKAPPKPKKPAKSKKGI